MVENDEKKGAEGWKMGVRVWKLVKRYKTVKEMMWKKRAKKWKVKKIPVKNEIKNEIKNDENDEKSGREEWKMGVRVWK